MNASKYSVLTVNHFRHIERSIRTIFLSLNGTEVAVDQEPFQLTWHIAQSSLSTTTASVRYSRVYNRSAQKQYLLVLFRTLLIAFTASL